jgi:Rps23 Pro-64 3,4-dihydroxylase Tpa1-like proline 4-hydroxylase
MADRLRQLINQEVIDRAAELAGQFGEAQPFRHVRIDDFFTPAFGRELSANFPPFDEKLAINEDGMVGNKAVHEKITDLGPAWRTLDELVASTGFRDLISAITGISELQYDPHYFGGGTHENRHGQGLDVHIDFNLHPITRQHRRLNMIVYLNEEWQDGWGGSIQLHKDPYLSPDQDQVVSISPRFNRCVVFETNEHSWHGFPRVDLPEDRRSISRRSFALYYYTDSRPEEETGPEHSTIYVDRPLGEEFQAGMKFDAECLEQIQELLCSRDRHIRRLYGNIKLLNTNIGRLKELRNFHEEQQAELEFLRREFDRVRREESLLRAENARLGQNLASGETEITRLRGRIQDLRSSTSWRLTRPLRKLKLKLRGLKIS